MKTQQLVRMSVVVAIFIVGFMYLVLFTPGNMLVGRATDTVNVRNTKCLISIDYDLSSQLVTLRTRHCEAPHATIMLSGKDQLITKVPLNMNNNRDAQIRISMIPDKIIALVGSTSETLIIDN